jgi:hypothetical protein
MAGCYDEARHYVRYKPSGERYERTTRGGLDSYQETSTLLKRHSRDRIDVRRQRAIIRLSLRLLQMYILARRTSKGGPALCQIVLIL